MVFKETKIKNIKEVTEPLKEEILKGDVHTIEEMKAYDMNLSLVIARKNIACPPMTRTCPLSYLGYKKNVREYC